MIRMVIFGIVRILKEAVMTCFKSQHSIVERHEETHNLSRDM
jgi:hypothetical protein